MIGWTKTRKKCSKHGLVLRNRDGYDRKGDYCPACGERLTIVSIPYLFQVYFHPALMIVPGLLAFLYGAFFMVLDVPGCIQGDRRNSAIVAEQKKIDLLAIEEQRKKIAEKLPSQWQTLYTGMDSCYYNSDKWSMLQNYFNDETQLPKLRPEELRMFLSMLNYSRRDDAFTLISKHMKSEVEP